MTSPDRNYQAYSTVFSSPVEMLGFTPTQAAADVQISFGSVRPELVEPLTTGPLWTANASEMLLSAPDLGRYYVTNGNSIIIDAPDRTARLVTVLAGIPVASILMQRNFLALHTAAFEHPDLGAVAVCGENGAGKSSLVTAMTKQGSRRICDNLGAITTEPTTGSHFLHQGPSSFRLWSHSAVEFDFDPAGAQRVSEDIDKYVFADGESESSGTPRPLKVIVCLQTHDKAEPAITRLDDISATASVAENHFRNDLASVMVPNWLDRLSALASDVPVYQLWRPETGCPPHQLAEFLEQELLAGVHN